MFHGRSRCFKGKADTPQKVSYFYGRSASEAYRNGRANIRFPTHDPSTEQGRFLNRAGILIFVRTQKISHQLKLTDQSATLSVYSS